MDVDAPGSSCCSTSSACVDAEKDPSDTSTVSNRLSMSASTAAVDRLPPPLAEANGSARLMPARTTGRTFLPQSLSSGGAAAALPLDFLEAAADDDDFDDLGDMCCILKILA